MYGYSGVQTELCVTAADTDLTRVRGGIQSGGDSKIALYCYWRSSSAWRVRIALAHKQLPYEYRAINLLQKESKSEEYTKLNPMQQIPLLVIDGHSLAQSVAICEYLEETRPQHPLYPSDKCITSFNPPACIVPASYLHRTGIVPASSLIDY